MLEGNSVLRKKFKGLCIGLVAEYGQATFHIVTLASHGKGQEMIHLTFSGSVRHQTCFLGKQLRAPVLEATNPNGLRGAILEGHISRRKNEPSQFSGTLRLS